MNTPPASAPVNPILEYLSYIPSMWEAFMVHATRLRFAYITAFVVAILLVFSVLFVPASDFPEGKLVTIPSNATFREAAEMLEGEQVISSALMFRALARITASDTDVRSGRYLFAHPEGAATILYRLANGVSGIPSVRITIPEGTTVREMSMILKESIPGFDADAFMTAALPYEGYLFPDTYDFYADATSAEIVERMRERFDEVWEEVSADGGERSSEGRERIVTMASILEKETKQDTERRVVSGILWDRIDIGIALQVDAVFGYIKGIPTYHPSGDDLELDSPYNTYENRDLPPGPIGNPGEDAMRAALNPSSSPYVYYLFGNDGQMHYAEDFEGHKANKEAYLR